MYGILNWILMVISAGHGFSNTIIMFLDIRKINSKTLSRLSTLAIPQARIHLLTFDFSWTTVRESLTLETMGPISVRYACGVTNAQLAAAKKYVAYYKEGLAVPCTSYVKVNLLHDLRYVTYRMLHTVCMKLTTVMLVTTLCRWLNLSERTSGEWPVTPKFFSTIILEGAGLFF